MFVPKPSKNREMRAIYSCEFFIPEFFTQADHCEIDKIDFVITKTCGELTNSAPIF